MEIAVLEPQKIDEWKFCFSTEIYQLLKSENSPIQALGVTFMEAPQGALCWEKQENTAVLYSIFIRPEARRLGLGSNLISYWLDQLRNENYDRVQISYVKGADQEMLVSFFTQCGFELDTISYPEGIITIADANENLLKKLPAKMEVQSCNSLGELSPEKIQKCRKWMSEQLEVSIDGYLGNNPSSFVSMIKGQLQGILLLRQQGADLWLDYCWGRQGASVTLMHLLGSAMEYANQVYTPETKIHMLLSTDEAKKLYQHLFGEVKAESEFCSGTYELQTKEAELFIKEGSLWTD